MELEGMKTEAWQVMMATARTCRVALQVGYLIERAQTSRDILLAVAMIGDFEDEEEAASDESRLSAA